ncbi:hypothetical protein NKH86_28370 [Mesorhizobium sp. M0913]|uniref:hypothetical protein n=1 Tax=Mesorhizobium sp. M0913 TaxID=2957026 RepID=UPI00333ACAA4
MAHFPHEEEEERAGQDKRQQQVSELRPPQRFRRQIREIEGIDEECGCNADCRARDGNGHDPAPARRGQIDLHAFAPASAGYLEATAQTKS